MTESKIPYGELVINDKVTCDACPTQVEGVLYTGECFYFRYRFGRAALAVGPSPEAVSGRCDVSMDYGDELDGTLCREEFEPLIMSLYQEPKESSHEPC